MQVGNLHIITAEYRKRDGLNHELGDSFLIKQHDIFRREGDDRK
jgi:hypothetical protein